MGWVTTPPACKVHPPRTHLSLLEYGHDSLCFPEQNLDLRNKLWGNSREEHVTSNHRPLEQHNLEKKYPENTNQAYA